MVAALGSLAPASSLGLPSRRFPSRRPCRAARLSVAANQRISEADLYQSVAPPGQQLAPQPAGQPWYVTGPLVVAGLLAALRIAKVAKKRLGGSNRLEERGFKRGGVADDKAYTSAIRGMRKMEYEELSDEQIAAARRRRQREVEKDMAPLDIENIELPDNHPFAVRKQLAPEEEELQRSRLSTRRRLSPEDMRRLREQQALADQMDAAEEARQAEQRRQAGQ